MSRRPAKSKMKHVGTQPAQMGRVPGPNSLTGNVILRVLELVKEYLTHHFWTLVILVTACVLIVAVVSIGSSAGCVTMSDTPLGSLSTCASDSLQTERDGLHGESYVDRRAGFALRLINPDQWSVLQAKPIGPRGGSVTFPAGLLAKVPVEIRANDVSTAFLSKKTSDGVVASAWVFRVTRSSLSIEQVVEAESRNPMRLGAAVGAYVATQAMNVPGNELAGDRDVTALGRAPTDSRVMLSKVQYAPDKSNALLIWEKPQRELPIDLIGRVVVTPRDIYYVVIIKTRLQGPGEHEINEVLRTLLNSFRAL